MTNPDNQRMLGDERGALEAETSLAREEQKLWQRLDAALSESLEKRTEGLAKRLASVEQSPGVNASEVSRAKGLVDAGRTPDPVPAQGERTASLSARRGALQARELALKALSAAVAQLEGARGQRAKDLDLLDSLLKGLETSAQKAASDAKAREESERRAREEAERQAAAAKKAAEAAAAAAASATAPAMPAVSDDMLKTSPGFPAYAEQKTSPGAPAHFAEEVKTSPGMPAAKAPEPKTEPGIRAVAAPVAAPATTTGSAKKVTRRRRVKLAPPPKKMEIEIATYGDDTFYTGFDNRIESGGVFTVSLQTLPKGHELDLELHLEGGQVIKSKGKVEFVRQDNMANPDCLAGAGIKLLNLSRDNVSAIESFLQKRAPMFYVQA